MGRDGRGGAGGRHLPLERGAGPGFSLRDRYGSWYEGDYFKPTAGEVHLSHTETVVAPEVGVNMTDAFVAERPGMDYLVERTGGEIVRDSLRIYRDYFGPLLLIYALPVLPVMLLSVYANVAGDPIAEIVVGILDILVAAFPYGAVTIAVADICLGNRPSLGSSYGGMLRSFWRYLGTYALYMAMVIVGIFLAAAIGAALWFAAHPVLGVVAGVLAFGLTLMVTFRYMFACQICVIERRGPIQSLRRSRHLIRGMFWRTVGLASAMLCMVYLLLFTAGVVWGVASLMMPPDANQALLEDLFVRLLTIAVTPVLLICFVLLYYDLRVRKENYDSSALTLELMS